MAPSTQPSHEVRIRRLARGWSQAELAERAGISRAAVGAIEGKRLVPSVAAALSLATVLECTVEQLFRPSEGSTSEPNWAWMPPEPNWRYWVAEVDGRMLRFPATSSQGYLHDGSVHDGTTTDPLDGQLAERTLVLACCDPAASLMSILYARMTGFRMLVVPRSSAQSLDLLATGVVHVAGLHLSSSDQENANSALVRTKLGTGFSLARVASWQDGIAFARTVKIRSIKSALGAKVRWIGREPGSGSHLCQNEVLQNRLSPKLIAHNHHAVADAIRSGWADAGVCLNLVAAESGLEFLPVREEFFELCFATKHRGDARIQALLRVLRSSAYRDLLDALPGYAVADTGEVQVVK